MKILNQMKDYKFLEISLITCLQNNPKFSEDLGIGKTVKFLLRLDGTSGQTRNGG